MANLSTYPYPSYEPNKPAAGVLAALVGISLLAWLFQSVRAHFQPVRLSVLLLISHLTNLIELILRVALPATTRNSRVPFAITSIPLSIGFRLIIVANYSFLIVVLGEKRKLSRAILIGAVLCAIISAILLIPAGMLSYNTNTIDTSFRLRQASATIILCLTVFFYPVWLLTKRAKESATEAEYGMTKRGIVLLIISSISCLVVAIFLGVTSKPDYYVGASQNELWFYICQLAPILIALFTWNILHPARSLVLDDQKGENRFNRK